MNIYICGYYAQPKFLILTIKYIVCVFLQPPPQSVVSTHRNLSYELVINHCQ